MWQQDLLAKKLASGAAVAAAAAATSADCSDQDPPSSPVVAAAEGGSVVQADGGRSSNQAGRKRDRVSDDARGSSVHGGEGEGIGKEVPVHAQVQHDEGTCGEMSAGSDQQQQPQQQPQQEQQQQRQHMQQQQHPAFARVVVTCEMLRGVLGPEVYESEVAARVSVPGMCTGLAWTPTGGELLFIECTSMPGSGAVKLTGKLGEVLRKRGGERDRDKRESSRLFVFCVALCVGFPHLGNGGTAQLFVVFFVGVVFFFHLVRYVWFGMYGRLC